MANPFFNALGGGMLGGANPMQIFSQFNQMLGQLKQNPLAMLQAAGLSVPGNLSNPQAIIQHLMNSGQITQQQMKQAQAMAQNFGLK